MDSENTSYLIIGFIIIIAVILVLIFILHITKNAGIFDKKELPKNTTKQYNMQLKAYVDGVPLYNIPYTLKEENTIVQQDILQQGYITEYQNVLNNTNYTFSLDTDLYYYDPVTCTIKNQFCQIYAQKVAVPEINYIDYQDFIRIILYIDSGIYKDIGFCIQENTDSIVGLEYDITIYEIPMLQRLEKNYYKCYSLNTTLQKGFFEFNINLKIDNSFKYRKGDKIKLNFIDLITESGKQDIKNNDIQFNINFD